MSKYEKENDPLNEERQKLLSKVIYDENQDKCTEIFGEDPIAERLLNAIVEKNPKTEKICVQRETRFSEARKRVDNKENILVYHAKSHYVIIIEEAENELKLWVVDLRNVEY